MPTITDLRKIFRWRKLVILLLINLLNDSVTFSFVANPQETGLSSDEKLYLFNRFFCADAQLLPYMMYLSFYGFIVFCVIERIREDNQKYGTFYLVRFSRIEYAFGKLKSTAIFSFFFCYLSVMQSFLWHRVSHISIPAKQYFIIAALSFLIAFATALSGLLIYSLTKKSGFTFLCSTAVFTLFALHLQANHFPLPSVGNVPMAYIYPAGIAILLLVPNFLLLLKGDWLTTKIKE